jgi:DNA mismatch repair protein MutS
MLQKESRTMKLDVQTFKDLEIFKSETGGSSLFDFCNFTRNKKGAEVLRERMKQPWSDISCIKNTQESITFIISQRQSFNRLPSYVTTEVVEDYFHGVLPLTGDNIIEFGVGVLEIRFGDPRSYGRILRGVNAACELIRALQNIAHLPELSSAGGELNPLLEEMRELLSHPSFAKLPDKAIWKMSFWTVMRIDQLLRLYEKSALNRLLELIYEIDALVSMADATHEHKLVMPTIEEAQLFIEGEDVVHPFLKNAVPNPVSLGQSQRMLFLTGPNMAGKTTYMRACAIAFYLAHLGMGVPAKSFRFAPAQCLFSSISLSDNLNEGVSYFRAEALRVKAVAQAIADGYSVFALMDEPFKGTNIKDALDASRKILVSFATKEGCLFMFSSHLIELSEQMSTTAQIDCRYFEAGESEGKLNFEYVLCSGVSNQRLGMRVLQEEGVFKLLDENL